MHRDKERVWGGQVKAESPPQSPQERSINRHNSNFHLSSVSVATMGRFAAHVLRIPHTSEWPTDCHTTSHPSRYWMALTLLYSTHTRPNTSTIVRTMNFNFMPNPSLKTASYFAFNSEDDKPLFNVSSEGLFVQYSLCTTQEPWPRVCIQIYCIQSRTIYILCTNKRNILVTETRTVTKYSISHSGEFREWLIQRAFCI